MDTKRTLVLGSLSLLLIAIGAYLWATGIMDSLSAYRSPLAANPPKPGAATGQPITRRVVLVMIDALREDTGLDPAIMPNLDALRKQGAWATMRSRTPSFSAPGWATILTGAWPDLNDAQTINPPDDDHVRTFTQDDIFAAADRAGLSTALSGYTWFEQMLANSGIDASFYTPGADNAADEDDLNAALPWLTDGDYQLLMVYFDQVDYAGHHEGEVTSPNWNASASRADALLGQVISTLDLGQDTVIVLSDHGQIAQGGHGGQDPITMVEPFVMAGAGVTPGRYADIQMVDVAPTIAALLGINIPASSQGHVLFDMLAIPSDDLRAIITSQLTAQQSQLAADYQKSIRYTAILDTNDSDPVAYNQTLIAEARSIRLKNERNPRLLLAVILALLPPGLFIYTKQTKAVIPLLVGGLIYTLLFNAIYALIVGKTYSLSSITSPTDLIMGTAIYVSISLLIAWLVTMLRQRAFLSSPAAAAQTSLALTFVTLYLLALPVLWSYYLNGPLVTWTLPDFGSMFLGFLSIAQGLFVAVIGLLLTGVAALVAKVTQRA